MVGEPKLSKNVPALTLNGPETVMLKAFSLQPPTELFWLKLEPETRFRPEPRITVPVLLICRPMLLRERPLVARFWDPLPAILSTPPLPPNVAAPLRLQSAVSTMVAPAGRVTVPPLWEKAPLEVRNEVFPL